MEIPSPVSLQQLLKVRSALDVGSVSADRVAWGLGRPTHPSAGHGAPRTSAAGGRLLETLYGAAGCSGDSPALQPHGAASGCAPRRKRFKSFGGNTLAAAPGGAAATFSPPPLARCGGLRGLGVLPASSRLCTERPRSWSAGSRCDYPSGGEAIILNARRKELQGLERTPNSMLLAPESPETHKIRPPLDPRV